MRMMFVMLSLALSAGTIVGCSDSNEGNTGIKPNALFPDGKAHKVSTTIAPAIIKAGDSAVVTCLVEDTAGNAVEATTTVSVTPDTGVTIDDHTVTASTSGTYRVVCIAPDLSVSDADGATLTVEAGTPVSIEAVLDPSTVAAGELSTVTCVLKDAEGLQIGAATKVSGSAEVTVTDHEVTSTTAGAYSVVCTSPDHPGLPTTPATLIVTGAAPAAAVLIATPDEVAYARGQKVVFSWTVTDTYGNPVDSVPGTVTGPSNINDLGDAQFRFVDIGFHDFTLTLDAPYENVTATKTLVCDDIAPVITITYPLRGATITGTGEAITVTGQVVENLGEIDAIVINGETPAVDDQGNFQIDVVPAWGVNFLTIYAKDTYENQGKLTPSFQYSAGYVSYVETDAQGVKVEDGAQAMLGQGVLDDGVHDPADVDDMATLLELVLTNLDIPALLEAQGGISFTTPIFSFNIPFAGQLSGDLITTVAIVPPTTLGESAVTLDSVTGGINTTIEIGNSQSQGLQLNLEISFDLQASIGSISAGGAATVPNQAQADKVTIQAKLALDKPAGGTLNAGVENLNLVIDGLNIDAIQDLEIEIYATGLPSFKYNLSQLVNLQDLTDAIIDPLVDNLGGILTDLVEPLLEDFATDAIQGLLEQFELDFDFTLPEFFGPKDPVVVNIYTTLSSALFGNDGGQLGLALGAYTPKGDANTHEPDGAITRQGCLVGDTEELLYDWERELGFGFQTDSLNMVFFAMWWSGFVHGPLDLGALLGESSPIPLDNLTLNLDPFAAPVINDCTKAAGVQLEIGDMKAEIKGSLLSLEIDATVFLDLRILVKFIGKEDGLYIMMDSMQFFDVEVVSVGPDVSEADNRDLLENQLKPLLEAFLIGQEFGPIEIPSLDFGGLIPGLTLPPGTDTELNIGTLEVSKDSGYVLIETDLD